MSIISNLIKNYASETITVENFKTGIADILMGVASFVEGTKNQVDDAVLAEIEADVNFDSIASNAATWLRTLLKLDDKKPMFLVPVMHAAPPKIFLGLVRAKLVSEVAKRDHISRKEARAKVQLLPDGDILKAAEGEHIGVGAIGDGTILAWLMAHLPDILALITKLLPLILA